MMPSGWTICDEMQICDPDSLQDSLQDRDPVWPDRDGGRGLRHHGDQGHRGRGRGHLPPAAGHHNIPRHCPDLNKYGQETLC